MYFLRSAFRTLAGFRFSHHRQLMWLAAVTTLLLSAMNLLSGDLKNASQLDWIDIGGNGVTVIMTALWFCAILSSRPPGRVTFFLSTGTLVVFLSFLQDFLDEFIRLPDGVLWDSILESVPLGMLILTWGIVLWAQEQRLLNQYLQRRELRFREHRVLDGLMTLPDSRYLQQLLQTCWQERQTTAPGLAVIRLDIPDLSLAFHELGSTAADRLQADLSELLRLSLRPEDLLCRAAGGRFFMLLPDTSASEADSMKQDILQLLHSYRFRNHGNQPLALQAVASLRHSTDFSQADNGHHAAADAFSHYLMATTEKDRTGSRQTGSRQAGADQQ